MSSAKEHRRVGAVAGGIAAIYYAQNTAHPIAEIVGGTIGGVIGAKAPDIIEPAIHSHHRDIAHSWATMAAIVKGAPDAARKLQQYCRARAANAAQAHRAAGKTTLCIEELTWHMLAGMVPGAAVGYLSHLALDATTPRGLPLLTRGM